MRTSIRRTGMAGSFALALFMVQSASADVATEARFFDAMARRAFERGEYAKALDAFLQVNAIAPLPRAMYNIAVCAELSKKPDVAFAYYRDYLSHEDSDTQRRDDARKRFAELQKTLALIEVSSDPQGAAIYVDRKELGQYGVTPRTIVVAPGERQILFEAEGYVGGEIPVTVSAGRKAQAEAQLAPKLGEIVVHATPADAKVEFLRDGKETKAQTRGGRYVLPLGTWHVRVAAPGYTPAEGVAVVREGALSEIAVAAMPVAKPTGRLLVGSGDVEGEVYLDRQRVAVTPATLQAVSVGEHMVEVRAKSGRVFSIRVKIEKGQASYVEAKLDGVAK